MKFHEAWHDVLDATLHAGIESAPRGKRVLERIGVAVRFDGLSALLVHPGRALNYRFAVAEWLWIARGIDLLAPLTRYNSRMAEFSDDGETLAGAYGPRLLGQWAYVVDKLRDDPDSRQAVASIWTPNPAPSRDVPCTLSVQFLVRDGRVHGIWNMRSSDLWLGLPYDAFSFARLTSCVAGELGLRTGFVEIHAGSSHLYKEHWGSAIRVIGRRPDGRTVRSPELTGFPQFAGTFHQEPWSRYADVLESRSSAAALEVLERP